jgi:hypothetical protein
MRRPSHHSDGLGPHSKVPVKDLPRRSPICRSLKRSSPAGPCMTSGLAACGRVRAIAPHIMEWVARQRFNGQAGDGSPGTFDA